MLRTLLQVIVAVCVAIPAAIALVPIPDRYAAEVAFVIGLAGAVVVIVTAVQNALEARAGVALFRSPSSGTDVVPEAADAPTSTTPGGPSYPRGPP